MANAKQYTVHFYTSLYCFYDIVFNQDRFSLVTSRLQIDYKHCCLSLVIIVAAATLSTMTLAIGTRSPLVTTGTRSPLVTTTLLTSLSLSIRSARIRRWQLLRQTLIPLQVSLGLSLEGVQFVAEIHKPYGFFGFPRDFSGQAPEAMRFPNPTIYSYSLNYNSEPFIPDSNIQWLLETK